MQASRGARQLSCIRTASEIRLSQIGSILLDTSLKRPYKRKKTLFPRGNRARQDGRVVPARGCLPTSHHLKLITLLLLERLLHYSAVPRLQHRLAAIPCCFPRKLMRLRVVAIASTACCFTALPRSITAANCHQRYGSKQRGGSPRRWGSVTCRSMENSLCREARPQLGEARGFGSLVWRIGPRARFPQTSGARTRHPLRGIFARLDRFAVN